MMAIAAQSKTLTEFRRALPPAVEPLYEIARLTKDAAGEKRLRAAVRRHELTPTSGIREIRTIGQSTRRRSTKPRAMSAAENGRAPMLEFVIEADDMLTWDVVEQFKAELTALLAKFNLRFPADGGLKNEAAIARSIEQRSAQDRADEGDNEERARLARIFSMPVLNHVISDEDFAALPVEPRAALKRELLERYERHRAMWDTDDVDKFFEKTDSERVHALSHEILEIAAKHGIPRAIAALKGKTSPEVKKATAIAKTKLKRERRAGTASERIRAAHSIRLRTATAPFGHSRCLNQSGTDAVALP
jgi:hypothetical protein